jgi:hypothetical protein
MRDLLSVILSKKTWTIRCYISYPSTFLYFLCPTLLANGSKKMNKNEFIAFLKLVFWESNKKLVSRKKVDSYMNAYV